MAIYCHKRLAITKHLLNQDQHTYFEILTEVTNNLTTPNEVLKAVLYGRPL
jgi:hypothetical protein